MKTASRLLGCLLVVASVGFATDASAQETHLPPAVQPAQEQRLDLNHATIDELCTLPGIGKKRAQTIVDYRQKRPFTRLTQLLRVRGIGKKTLRRLKPLLRVERPRLSRKTGNTRTAKVRVNAPSAKAH